MSDPSASDARTGKILVVDDEAGMREFLEICLTRDGHAVQTAAGGAQAIELLDEYGDTFDLVITDLTMPGVDGMAVLRHATSLADPPLVLMVTAYASADTAVEAMKLGAIDYLLKPFKVDEIQIIVRRTLERRALATENLRLREALRGVHRLDRMVGRAPSMQRVFELVRKVAPTRTNILISGESGTGKELVARALHNLSDRANGPFVPVNCGAIPESLMESELFGHVRGAFTGANVDREGMFAAADGGTLFLDEIGELDASTQVKLLRVLQERKIRPVGAPMEHEVDCRVVAATNRDLQAAVDAGEFRQDLYFRLNVVQVVLPPLRQRKEDIPPLVERFFQRYNAEMGGRLEGVAPEAIARLLDLDYPGNVRELENIIERAVALETSKVLGPDHVPAPRSSRRAELTPGELDFPAEGIDLDRELSELEQRWIEAALRASGGVRKHAAERLGISFRSLRYRLKKLGIDPGSGTSE